MADRVDEALAEFKRVLAEERGRYGRDFIRGKPQGLLLDALDAGAPDTSHDDWANRRGSIRRKERWAETVAICEHITAVNQANGYVR